MEKYIVSIGLSILSILTTILVVYFKRMSKVKEDTIKNTEGVGQSKKDIGEIKEDIKLVRVEVKKGLDTVHASARDRSIELQQEIKDLRQEGLKKNEEHNENFRTLEAQNRHLSTTTNASILSLTGEIGKLNGILLAKNTSVGNDT